MLISLLGWIVVGLTVGFVASRVIDLRGDDPRLGIALGVTGAVAGGFLQGGIGSGVGAFSFWSLLVALAGAVAAMAVWHGMRWFSPRV